MIKNKIKLKKVATIFLYIKKINFLSILYLISFSVFCNVCAMDEDKGFNPNGNTWYRVINKSKLIESEAKGAFLDAGGYENESCSKKLICCSPYSFNNFYTQWKFKSVGNGYYNIISREYESKQATCFLTDNKEITLTDGKTGHAIKWQITNEPAGEDKITARFYRITSENEGILGTDFKGDIELLYLYEGDVQFPYYYDDKIKWMFLK
jgi:hypothetical protein